MHVSRLVLSALLVYDTLKAGRLTTDGAFAAHRISERKTHCSHLISNNSGIG